MSPLLLSDLSRCFQGVIPSMIATSDQDGVPNITYVSQVHLVDEHHVALSCQFFNKTRRNLDVNPLVRAEVLDPLNLQAYRLKLRFLRSEKSGPLFDSMAIRLDAIASHTGMAGVFRLIAADVFEVLEFEKVEGFLTESPDCDAAPLSLEGLRSEIRGLQWLSERINRACDLEQLLRSALEALEEYFHFTHTMVLLHDEQCGRLFTVASRGYGESGVGAEVRMGEGMIGTAAKERKVLRLGGIDASLRYARAIRRELLTGPERAPSEEIPLPGLADAQSALLIPLCVGDRVLGVLAAESRDPLRFGDWDEAYLGVVGNQIALNIDRMQSLEEEASTAGGDAGQDVIRKPASQRRHKVVYYRSDDCLFVDDSYLIRNVPGRILWRLLTSHQSEGRSEFSNRELRLDSTLGLPSLKDNLESRLILLRHRLQEKCPDLRIVPTGRGRFRLDADAHFELMEKP